MADQMIVTPFVGMWLSIFVILPISIFLTIKAKNDAPLIDSESYFNPIAKIQSMLNKKRS